MNGMKPSHLSTPRTLQECTFQSGYKGGISSDQEEQEQAKSWILLLSVFLILSVLASLSFS